MKTEKTPVTATQEKYFRNTFPLIHLIVSQKLTALYTEYGEDIKQKVVLSLWKWKLKRPEKELSEEEWLKLSNTSTTNEIKRFYSTQMSQTVSLSDISENVPSDNFPDSLLTNPPTGNTNTEVRSLLLEMWKAVKKQSLREKAALLLPNRKIINYFYYHRCCDITELAGALELNPDEFKLLYHSLPLSDTEIGLWLGKKLNQEIKADQIHKARHRMRGKLQPFKLTG
ncbi:MAG TPA: hypothetical protein PKY82_00725 [Pyrinomonadaceae bacterium]|nr:hypothetical protein [Pyrinomonadaceae bacterium]